MQQIEQKERQPGGVAGVGRGLDPRKRGDAVGADAAQFAVEIGLAGIERRHSFGDRWIFARPVEAGAGQQFDRTLVDRRVHAVAVIFDFVEPLIAVRRRVDQLRELRQDPFRQSGRVGAPVCSTAPWRKRRAIVVPAHMSSDFPFAYASATVRRAPIVWAAS
jgi:hypothetical protein